MRLRPPRRTGPRPTPPPSPDAAMAGSAVEPGPRTTRTGPRTGRCRAASARRASGPGAVWSSVPRPWRSLITDVLSEVVIPILVALLLAALLQPVYALLTRIVPRGLAAGITVIGTLAMVFGLLSFVGSQLTSHLDDIGEEGRRRHRPDPPVAQHDLRRHRQAAPGLHRPGPRVAELGQPQRRRSPRRASPRRTSSPASSSRCSPSTSSSTTGRASGAGWCGCSPGPPARRCAPPA